MKSIKNYFSNTKNIVNIIISLLVIYLVIYLTLKIKLLDYKMSIDFIAYLIQLFYFLIIRFAKKSKLKLLNNIYAIYVLNGLIGNFRSLIYYFGFFLKGGIDFYWMSILIHIFCNILIYLFIIFIIWGKKLVNTKQLNIITNILIVLTICCNMFYIILLLDAVGLIFSLFYLIMILILIMSLIYFKQYAEYKIRSNKNE